MIVLQKVRLLAYQRTTRMCESRNRQIKFYQFAPRSQLREQLRKQKVITLRVSGFYTSEEQELHCA